MNYDADATSIPSNWSINEAINWFNSKTFGDVDVKNKILKNTKTINR